MRLSLLTYLFFSILSISLIAQDKGKESFRDRFEEANILMEDHYFSLALPIWQSLLKEDPDNANLNYKIGGCYYNYPTEEVKGLPYYRKAIKNVNKNYDPFSHTERGVKPDAYFYLAHVYHIAYELDSALLYFNKFLEEVSKKHILREDALMQIEMCNNAKRLMQNPIPVYIHSLGHHINTEYSEHSPIISLDEKELFFTSRRLRADSSNIKYKDLHDGHYFEDVYVSYKDDGGNWTEPELLNLNRANQHLATIGLSSDYQTLYLFKDDGKDGNIYSSSLIHGRWSKPLPMEGGINSKAHETHITISPDRRTLFFASDRKGGLGGFDIYRCNKLPNGEWSEPVNVGPPINTPYDEDSPYIHPDKVTLYYSHKGHNSMGGFDIFYSEIQEDGSWSEPTNIGYPINTTHDDLSYVTSPDGKRSYYSSFGGEDSYGEKDIYVIEKIESEEKRLTLLKGHISVPDGQSMPANVVVNVTDNETGKLVAEARPLRRNGNFVFIIPPGKNYNISYDVDGKEFYNENLYVPYGSDYQEIEKEIRLDPVNLTAQNLNQPTVRRWKIRFEHLDQIVDSLVLKYLDDEGNILYTEKPDKYGYFAYRELRKDQNYIVSLEYEGSESTSCEGMEIILDENGREAMKLIPNSGCVFVQPSSSVKDKKVIAKVDLTTLPIDKSNNLVINYISDDGELLFSEQVDSSGYFSYHPLQSDKPYHLQLVSEDEEVCEEMKLYFAYKENESEILIDFKMNENCMFAAVDKADSEPTNQETVNKEEPPPNVEPEKEPTSSESSDEDTSSKKKLVAQMNLTTLPLDMVEGLTINYVDDEGTILFSEKIDKEGRFEYHELSPDVNYHLELISENEDICNEAQLTFSYPDDEADVVVSFQLNKNCEFVPVTIEKLYFEEFFTYNKNVPQRDAELNQFVKSIVKRVSLQGSVKVSIESSASRVPTKTYKTNENLTKIRAQKAKDMLLEQLKTKGVGTEQVTFVNITTLVQGPKYQGDYLKNKSVYEKYQYVKIFSE